MASKYTHVEYDELTIDEEFSQILGELTEHEKEGLRQQLEEHGQRDAVIVWANHHNTIVDGHNRAELLKGKPIRIEAKHFADRNAVIEFICSNQLSRRNQTPEQRTYTLGKQYAARKKAVGEHTGNQYTKVEGGQSDHIPKDRTCEAVARDNNTSEKTVRRAFAFATDVDDIAAVAPAARTDILNGRVKLSRKEANKVATVAKDKSIPESKRRAMIEASLSPRAKSEANGKHDRNEDGAFFKKTLAKAIKLGWMTRQQLISKLELKEGKSRRFFEILGEVAHAKLEKNNKGEIRVVRTIQKNGDVHELLLELLAKAKGINEVLGSGFGAGDWAASKRQAKEMIELISKFLYK